MDAASTDLLKLHDSNAEALRHSSDVIWRFAIAIVTLQGAALGLFAQAGLKQSIGKWVLVGGFMLAVFFSMMLIRQAKERSGFVDRIEAIETELRKTHPHKKFFKEIPKGVFGWFKSWMLAWLLFLESAVGFLLSLLYAFSCTAHLLGRCWILRY
jgi:hypothetical protein